MLLGSKEEDERTALTGVPPLHIFPKAYLGCGPLRQLLVTLVSSSTVSLLSSQSMTVSWNRHPVLHATLKYISSLSQNTGQANLPSALRKKLPHPPKVATDTLHTCVSSHSPWAFDQAVLFPFPLQTNVLFNLVIWF